MSVRKQPQFNDGNLNTQTIIDMIDIVNDGLKQKSFHQSPTYDQ